MLKLINYNVKKLIISMLLLSCMIIISLAFSAYAYEEDIESVGCNDINAIPDNITSAEKVREEKLAAKKYENVLRNLQLKEQEKRNEELIDPLSDPEPGTEVVKVYVPYRKQITAYYCGPASAQQVLAAIGKESSVSSSTKSMWWWRGCCIDGNFDNIDESNWAHPYSTTHNCYDTYTHKQVTLADDIGTTLDGSVMRKIKNTVNYYNGSSYYVVSNISSSSSYKTFFRNVLHDDLVNKHPLIGCVKTQYLSYYDTKDRSHYITFNKIEYTDYDNMDTILVGIVDPHYKDEFGGNHPNEMFNNVYTALYKYYDYVGGANYNLMW